MKNRRCSRCGKEKPLNTANFYQHKSGAGGFRATCKVCRKGESRDHCKKNLRHRYDMAPEEFAALLAKQGGGCAICGGIDRLHVDHCHDTGVVRGILCGLCNIMLGHARNTADVLRRAIAYLEGSKTDVSKI